MLTLEQATAAVDAELTEDASHLRDECIEAALQAPSEQHARSWTRQTIHESICESAEARHNDDSDDYEPREPLLENSFYA